MTDHFPQPLGGNEMPRFGGIATLMRLPSRTELCELDVVVVGAPFEIGVTKKATSSAVVARVEHGCR